MNSNAQKWIDTLLFGEYQQTQSRLKDETGYCCLGVACDLYRKETGEGEWKPFGNDGEQYLEFEGREYRFSLPSKVAEWLGLRTSEGNYGRTNRHRSSLVELNDDGRSFRYIAVMIRREPKNLFGDYDDPGEDDGEC